MTDTERIDYLEKLNDKADYTGLCLLRMSTTGRGWRLLETEQEGGHSTVREAIDAFVAESEFAFEGKEI